MKISDAWRAEIMRHRAERELSLRAPDGWLALVERVILEPGDNEVLDAIATLEPDSTVRLKAADGQSMRVADATTAEHVWRAGHREGVAELGGKRYELLRQGELVAVRVRDPLSEARAAFAGLEYFEINERFCVNARNHRTELPQRIDVATGLGATVSYECPGTLAFEIDGQPLHLDPVIEPSVPGRYFVIFRDRTAPDETYGAGRFLYVDAPGPDGTTVIDFNRAYNPPCALTPFASCPMPPPQNELPVRIEAGEKKPR